MKLGATFFVVILFSLVVCERLGRNLANQQLGGDRRRGAENANKPKIGEIRKRFQQPRIAVGLDRTGILNPKFKIEQEFEGNSISSFSSILENHQASFLCPRGSFISDLTYSFVQTAKDDYGAPKKFSLKDRPRDPGKFVRFQKISGDRHASSPPNGFWNGMLPSTKNHVSDCDSILYCLGYQACLFKLTISLCAFDPIPGRRKVLHVKTFCSKDHQLQQFIAENVLSPEHVRRLRERTNSILYLSVYDDPDVTNFTSAGQVTVRKDEIAEREVFEISCPKPSTVKELGYAGMCTKEPPTQIQVSNQLFPILGRVAGSVCRKELLEVYCAFHYNKSGGCIPPSLTVKHDEVSESDSGSLKFNFKSLPLNGRRPDMSEHAELTRSKHTSLIPARLGFAILAHSHPEALVQLLESIYRPYFFYCIHVDERNDETREALKVHLKPYSNIHVLPKERSFAASWGSYEIVRAELECFEELLRMGTWDFTINLSGSDLPLRNVDDMAAALASARGHTFLKKLSQWRESGRGKRDTDTTVWYSCDSHVYNLTRRDNPLPWADIHSSSQWGVFARSFVEYVVSSDRGQFNYMQLYAQTCIIPDESYIMTALALSPLNHTHVPGNLHLLEKYKGKDALGFCRHTDDIDYCGQGPALFSKLDLPKIKNGSMLFMFARKFSFETSDQVRREVLEWSQTGFYSSLSQHFISKELISWLASAIVKYIQGNNWKKQVKIDRIAKWRIFPELIPKDPCCKDVVKLLYYVRGVPPLEYRYWIDIMLTEITDGSVKRIRASVRTKRKCSCFGHGHLKALHLSTIPHNIVGLKKYRSNSMSQKILAGVPLPYELIANNSLWINAFFKAINNPNSACDQEAQKSEDRNYHYASFNIPPNSINGVKNITFNAAVYNPKGKMSCTKIITFPWKSEMKSNSKNKNIIVISVQLANCGHLYEGLWKLEMYQIEVPNPYPYVAEIYLVNSKSWKLEHGVSFTLWKVEDAAVIPTDGNFHKAYRLNSQKIEPLRINDLLNKKTVPEQFLMPVGGLREFESNHSKMRERTLAHRDKMNENINRNLDHQHGDQWVKRFVMKQEYSSNKKTDRLGVMEKHISNILTWSSFLKYLIIAVTVFALIKIVLVPLKLVRRRSTSGPKGFCVFVMFMTLLQIFLYSLI